MTRHDLTRSADDHFVWYAVDAAYTFEGGGDQHFNQLIFLRDGRALARLQFLSYYGPFPDDHVQDLVDVARDRLAIIAQ